MTKKLSLSLFPFLIFSLGSSAWAAPKIILDENGMPRCIEGGAPGTNGLAFYWNEKDRYQRDTYAIRLDSQLASQLNPKAPAPSIDCSQWKRIRALRYSLKGQKLTDTDSSLDEYKFDSRTLLALSEVRVGANEFHPEQTGEEYLQKHPIPDFTVEIDRDLTTRFGAGFTAEIYRTWILSNPINSAFYEKMTTSMTKPAMSLDALRDQVGNRVVLFVKGLGHELKSAERFNILPDELNEMKIPTVLVDTPSFAPVRDNAELIRTQLHELLSQGKNVILISLSKGTSESFYAISSMKSEIDDPQPGHGKLEAFISLSGVYAPSYLIDWASKEPEWLVTEHELETEFKASGLPKPDISGLKDLAVTPMNQILSEIQSMGIPQSPIYINIVGTLTGNGLASDPDVRQLQDSIIRKVPMSAYGANDGYIEYPGTEIPKSWVTRRYVLPVRSSHSIIDGSLADLSLGSSQGARALIQSLLVYCSSL